MLTLDQMSARITARDLDGGITAAGSQSWKWQLRDRKGRWIQMGDKVQWFAGGKGHSGKLTGSPKEGVAQVKDDDDGRVITMPSSRLTSLEPPKPDEKITSGPESKRKGSQPEPDTVPAPKTGKGKIQHSAEGGGMPKAQQDRLSTGKSWTPPKVKDAQKQNYFNKVFSKIRNNRTPDGAVRPGRPDGDGTAEDPIYVGRDLDKARELLLQDKHIRLESRQDLVRLLDKEFVDLMKSSGKKDLNMCLVTVPDTSLFCADEETEILTARGWQRYTDIVPNQDVVYSLNHETGLAEWAALNAVNIFPEAERDMLSLEGRAHSSLTTLDHKWAVVTSHRAGGPQRNWRTSATLRHHDRIPLAAPAASPSVEQKYTDAFVELVAWTWTEGTLPLSGGLSIYQSMTKNPDRVALIRAALSAAFGPSSAPGDVPRPALKGGRTGVREGVAAWRETHLAGTGMTTFHLNSTAAASIREVLTSEKAVRPEFLMALTAAQLNLFIDTSLLGDGVRRTRGLRVEVVTSQRNEDRIRSFEMACSLAGIATRTRATADGKGGTMYRTTLMRSAVVRPYGVRMKTVKHHGIVWCPTTSTGTWLARRRGTVFFTGNCDGNVDVSRDWMPQLSGDDKEGKGKKDVQPWAEEMMTDLGLIGEIEDTDPNTLGASQNQLKTGQIIGMKDSARNWLRLTADAQRLRREGKTAEADAMEADRDKRAKDPNDFTMMPLDVLVAPILVTDDGYIIDGHHRWAATILLNEQLKSEGLPEVPMQVRRVKMEIGEALVTVNAFADASGIARKSGGADSGEMPEVLRTSKIDPKVQKWMKDNMDRVMEELGANPEEWGASTKGKKKIVRGMAASLQPGEEVHLAGQVPHRVLRTVSRTRDSVTLLLVDASGNPVMTVLASAALVPVMREEESPLVPPFGAPTL